jgi:hypothetical protein
MPAWLERRLPHLHIERPDVEAPAAPAEREKVVA